MSDDRKNLVYGFDYEKEPCRDVDLSYRIDFVDRLDKAKKYMHPIEIRVVQLLMFGNGSTRIAKIFGYNARQCGESFINNIIVAVRFFCDYFELIDSMHLILDIRDYTLMSKLFVLRYPYKWVAVDYNRCVAWVCYRLKQIADKHVELKDMIKRYTSSRALRSWWIYMEWRTKFREYIDDLQKRGVWYEWGGQSVDKGVADCSGLVIDVFKKIGIFPNSFADRTANALAELFDKTDQPECGDLVFYGPSWDRIKHVMFYVGTLNDGEKDLIGDYVVGMCGGGNSTTKKWYAEKFGIGLWYRKTKYRRDYLGIKKVSRRF